MCSPFTAAFVISTEFKIIRQLAYTATDIHNISNNSATFSEGKNLGPKTYKYDINVSGIHIIVKHVNLSIVTNFRQNRLNVS